MRSVVQMWWDHLQQNALNRAFDRLNRQHSGEFDQNFSRKVKCPGVCAREGGGAMGGFGIDWYIIG